MQEVTAEILIERVWSYVEKICSGEIKVLIFFSRC